MRPQAALCSFAILLAGQSPSQVEWLYYGGDQAGTKYSPLADINPANIQQLQIAWQWKHWETPLKEYDTIPGFFEGTPLMIGGVLYVTTPYNNIAALDAETGKELWRFDGEGYKLGQLLSASGWRTNLPTEDRRRLPTPARPGTCRSAISRRCAPAA